ncbi:MAG: hypothetical protein FWH11_13245 [Micrococcales bacterium]|nr:hypothetical protein [Micrococcales bacterium]
MTLHVPVRTSRRTAGLLVVVALAAGMAACSTSPVDDPPTSRTADPADSEPAATPSDTSGLTEVAEQALTALQGEDYAALAELVDPDEGVVFAPYSWIADDSVVLSAQEVSQLGTSSTTYTWGALPSGDPLEATFAEYRAHYVCGTSKYDWEADPACYTDAPLVGVDRRQVGEGSYSSNISEHFGPTAHWVEYAFPSSDGSVDYSALRLVFRDQDKTYSLIGIVHDEWGP